MTAANGGAGLGGVVPEVVGAGGLVVARGATASNGSYKIRGLPPSAAGYTVCFFAGGATGGSSPTGYASQCYKNVPWDGANVLETGTTPVLVLAGAFSTANAALVSAAGISGKVTAAVGGAGLQSVQVDVFDGSGNMVAQVPTGVDGTYAVKDLALSTAGYTACFDASKATGGSSTTGYASQCYKNVAWQGIFLPPPAGTAPIAVANGVPNVINVALSAAGTLSGTVTAAAGGVLQNVTVEVFDGSRNQLASVSTDANGSYSIKGLVPSTAGYTVCFNAFGATGGASTTGYTSQCNKNVLWSGGEAPPPSGITAVPLALGGTATVNAALTAGSAVSGTVGDASTSGGLGSVVVRAFDNSGDFLTSAPTGSSGSYTLTGLAASTAGDTVCFDPTNTLGGPYGGQCYKNVPWTPPVAAWTNGNPATGSTAVPLTAGVTATGINAALSAQTHQGISGKVTAAAGGAGLGGVVVQAFDSGGTPVGSAATASDGTYSIELVPSATGYTVCFDGTAGTGASAGGYLGQCYSNLGWRPGQPPAAGAKAVPVTTGMFAAVNVALVVAGAITGTVTAATGGKALALVSVAVFDATGTEVASGVTDSTGTYLVKSLPPSVFGYAVCFDPTAVAGTGSNGGYLAQCYKNVTWARAGGPAPGSTAVPVSAGTVASGINAALASAGAISGGVTSASSGTGIGNVSIDVFDANGTLLTSATTLSDGTYTVSGLAASSGDTVCFDPTQAFGGGSPIGYAAQCAANVAWVTNSPPPTGAKPVRVSAGATTTGVNAQLTAPGAIAGRSRPPPVAASAMSGSRCPTASETTSRS